MIGIDWRIDLDDAWRRRRPRPRSAGQPRPRRAPRRSRHRAPAGPGSPGPGRRPAGPHLQPRPRRAAADARRERAGAHRHGQGGLSGRKGFASGSTPLAGNGPHETSPRQKGGRRGTTACSRRAAFGAGSSRSTSPPRTGSMKSLEKRLFHLFPPADIAKARAITPASLACPRVGQVRATVVGDDGDKHEVQLELSARRRGGMTLETRLLHAGGPGRQAVLPCSPPCSSRSIAAGCSRASTTTRRSRSTSSPMTPPTTSPTVPPMTGDRRRRVFGGRRGIRTCRGRHSRLDCRRSRRDADPRGSPPWAADLEDRRRLVEPAVTVAWRSSIPDQRRAGGTLVFVLDLAASADARAAVLVPAECSSTSPATPPAGRGPS